MNARPFLTVVTRHMTARPTFYARCLASLAVQTCQDFEHLVIIDDTGCGMAWANAQFAVHRDEIHGEYVLLLDDDDELAEATAVEELQRAACCSRAGLILFRVDHGKGLGVLPDAAVWGKAPVLGHIGGASLIVQTPIWQRHIGAFARPTCGDFAFLRALWQGGYSRYWLDRVLVRVQRVSRGRAE